MMKQLSEATSSCSESVLVITQEVVVVQMSDHLLPEDPLIYFDYMRRKGDRSVV